MTNYFDKYDIENQSVTKDAKVNNPTGTSIVDDVKDVGLSLVKGAVSVPDSLIGVADTLSTAVGLNKNGRMVRDSLANKDGLIRFDPREAGNIISAEHSKGYREKQKEFSGKEGFADSAAYILKNPTLAVNAIAESAPQMLAGGAVGRGVQLGAKAGAKALGLNAGGRLLASDVAAGAIGEGVLMAGSQAANIQEETGGLTQGQALASIGTGAIGAGLGALGGKVAQRLGLADADSYIAGKLAGKVMQGEADKVAHGILSIPNAAVKGAIAEGVLEELPQSVAETVIGNLATDKHWSEGLGQSAALGLVTGGLMGAGFGASSGLVDYQAFKQKEKEQESEKNQIHNAESSNEVQAVSGFDSKDYQPFPTESEAQGLSRDNGVLEAAAADAVDLANPAPYTEQSATAIPENPPKFNDAVYTHTERDTDVSGGRGDDGINYGSNSDYGADLTQRNDIYESSPASAAVASSKGSKNEGAAVGSNAPVSVDASHSSSVSLGRVPKQEYSQEQLDAMGVKDVEPLDVGNVSEVVGEKTKAVLSNMPAGFNRDLAIVAEYLADKNRREDVKADSMVRHYPREFSEAKKRLLEHSGNADVMNAVGNVISSVYSHRKISGWNRDLPMGVDADVSSLFGNAEDVSGKKADKTTQAAFVASNPASIENAANDKYADIRSSVSRMARMLESELDANTLKAMAYFANDFESKGFDLKGFKRDVMENAKSSSLVSDEDAKEVSDALYGNPKFSRNAISGNADLAHIGRIKDIVKSSVGSLNNSYIDVVSSDDAIKLAGNDVQDLHGVQGWFDPKSGRITLVADNLNEEDAAFVAWHELGHRKIAVSSFEKWKAVFKSAYYNNAFLREIAHEIREQRKGTGDLAETNDYVAIEEAFVELYSAWKNGNYGYLADKYGVDIPIEYRGNRLQRFINRVLNALRSVLSSSFKGEYFDNDKIVDMLKRIDSSVHNLAQTQTERGILFDRFSDLQDRIFKYVDDMGLFAHKDSSSLSFSSYIEIYESLEHFENSEGKTPLKIRISNHKLPISYEYLNDGFLVVETAPDFVLKQTGKDFSYIYGNWKQTVEFIAKYYGRELPKSFQAAINRQKANAKKKAEAIFERSRILDSAKGNDTDGYDTKDFFNIILPDGKDVSKLTENQKNIILKKANSLAKKYKNNSSKYIYADVLPRWIGEKYLEYDQIKKAYYERLPEFLDAFLNREGLNEADAERWVNDLRSLSNEMKRKELEEKKIAKKNKPKLTQQKQMATLARDTFKKNMFLFTYQKDYEKASRLIQKDLNKLNNLNIVSVEPSNSGKTFSLTEDSGREYFSSSFYGMELINAKLFKSIDILHDYIKALPGLVDYYFENNKEVPPIDMFIPIFDSVAEKKDDGVKFSRAKSIKAFGVNAYVNRNAFENLAKDKRIDALKLALPTLGRRQIVDIYGDTLSSLRDYDDLSDRFAADSNMQAVRADELVRKWGRLKDGKQLADLMHDATLVGVDADIANKNAPLMMLRKIQGALEKADTVLDELKREAVGLVAEERKAKSAFLLAEKKERKASGKYAAALDGKNDDALEKLERAMIEAMADVKAKQGDLMAVQYRRTSELPRLMKEQRAEIKRLEYANRSAEDALEKSAGLFARFSQLSDESKQVYRQARDDYAEHFKSVKDAIQERMMRTGADDATIEAIGQKFENALQGVYFPLARYGKYVVSVRDYAGKVVSVSRAETMAEARTLQVSLSEQFKNEGYSIGRIMLDKEYSQSQDAVSKGFMKDLHEALGKLDIDDAKMADIRDTLGQLYLNSMPDLSWAKHGIHRKGTPGFSDDARRAYAQNMFHGTSYLSKLRYGDLMEQALLDMQKEADDKAKSDVSFNQPEAQRVIDEMNKRHDAVMNPTSSKLSTALTSFGFLYYLGLSPASAIVNLSQTALVAYPVMAAKWGAGKSMNALLKASRETAGKKGGYNNIREHLSDDEKEAFQKALDYGVIDISQAHDLAGIAQGEDSGILWKTRGIMRAASWMFHQAELFNRQVTFIAAYRLAKAEHGDSIRAFDEAKKATYDSHFDYSAQNRPRFMMGSVAKVVFLFKQYSQNMMYTLSRNAYLSTKSDKQAMKTLAGILLTHAMAAGVLGLPMVGNLLAAASWLGSDDDEPYDAEAELRNFLAQALGHKTSEVISKGVSRLTPLDISGRVGLSNLIFPDIQEGLSGARAAESFAAGLIGPILSIGTNAAKGINLMADGEYVKGLENMLPVSIRNPLKAYRLAKDGYIDNTGITVKDDFNVSEIAGQALGFSSSDLRLAMEGRGSIFRADREIRERRTKLVSSMAKALMDKDKAKAKEIYVMINSFNRKNPTLAISQSNINASVRNRMRRINESENGVYLPRNRKFAMDAGNYAVN